jgi:hypothetical protein
MKRVRLLAIPLFAILMGIALLLPLSAGAATASKTSGTLTQQVSGTTSGTVPHGTFSGALTMTKFVSKHGQLYAVGTLSGTATNAAGASQTVTSAPVTVPITSADPSCTILTLHTGAIHLNVLGLVVDISPITISITAQQGPGNLLGNLLCAIANLLNGGAPLSSIAGLLNQLLAAL